MVLPLAVTLALAVASTPEVELGAHLTAARPSALGTGLLLGPAIAGDLALGALRVGARIQLGWAAENDLTWRVAHTELRVGARAGAAWTLGRGELSVGATLGALVLREARTRHQADRLDQAGIDAETGAWATGPLGALDAAVQLRIVDAWAVALAGGPSLAWLDGAAIPGWGASLGVAFRWGAPP